MLRGVDKKLHIVEELRSVMPKPEDHIRYVRRVLDDTPVAFWPMQEASGLPQDISGSAAHMTSATNARYRKLGPMGDDYAIQTQAATLNRSSVVSTATDDFTMEVIVDINTAGNDDPLFHNGAPASNGWGIRMESAGTFRGLAGGVAELANGGQIMTTQNFVHLVVLRRATIWEYYVDGVVTDSNAGNATPGTPATSLLMGDSTLGMNCSYMAVYDSPLTADQIASHYEATGGLV